MSTVAKKIETGLDVDPMFPMPVGRAHIGREITEEEISFLRGADRHSTKTPEGRVWHNNWGPPDANLVAHPEMKDIFDFCGTAILSYFKFVWPSAMPRASLSFTQTWFNIRKRGGQHEAHDHSNSFISAVFNVWGEDPIIFEPPKTSGLFGSIRFGYETSGFAPDFVPIVIPAGGILIFPSHLVHSVPRIEDPAGRCTISMNTFPVGSMGDGDNLNSLMIGGVGIGENEELPEGAMKVNLATR